MKITGYRKMQGTQRFPYKFILEIDRIYRTDSVMMKADNEDKVARMVGEEITAMDLAMSPWGELHPTQ